MSRLDPSQKLIRASWDDEHGFGERWPWKQPGVVEGSDFYTVYVRSFKDSNGDGIGDLTGVIDKLGYLRETLGVDALYLSGILQSPWREYGFDVSDHRAIHPKLGIFDTFDELIRRTHQMGLKIVIDFIPNHTSDQHPWFLESRGTRTNGKRDWYIWRDPSSDGTPPNNWLSRFGGPAWEWDNKTWQYYLHSFLPAQPDLNWQNEEVKAEMFEVARFWLDRGVDGFRVDAADHIGKHPQMPNHVPAEPRTVDGLRAASDYQRHEYDRGHPSLHRVYQELRRLVDSYSSEAPRVLFGEVHPTGGWPEWATYFGRKLDELHIPVVPNFAGVAWQADKVSGLIQDMMAALPANAWPNIPFSNFDEWRVATRYGDSGARQAAILMLTLQGTPFLYYGEEVGMTNGVIPPDDARDEMGKRIGLSRDPQRTPMQWDAGVHAGFAPADANRPWLPIASDYRTRNVEVELRDPTSILTLYRDLIRIRKGSPALTHGSYQAGSRPPEGCLVYGREYGNERVAVAMNLTDRPQQLAIASSGQGQVLLTASRQDEGALVELSKLQVAAHDAAVIRLENG